MWQAEVRVDLDAIRHNVHVLRSRTTAAIMAVVKADAYGHGLVPAAAAATQAGATWLGVATLEEALRLRAAGIQVPILAWLFAPGLPLHTAVAAEIDLSVASLAQVAEVVTAAQRAGRQAHVHLKVDTGLHRSGAPPEVWSDVLEAAAKAAADGHIDVIGVWSHFANADTPDHPANDQQLAAFHSALELAARYGIEPPVRHLANSPAMLTRPETHFDLVRPGISIYGLSPIEGESYDLRPAMSVHARIPLTKRVPAGEGVSYGHTYHTPAESTLALVPLGYGDGIPRAASNAVEVAINGHRHPLVGRVCMDQFVVNVGDAAVSAGDEAVLFGAGTAGEPTADDWAAATGTVNYEIVTRMGSGRIPRVHLGVRE
jgi:alanine racemase